MKFTSDAEVKAENTRLVFEANADRAITLEDYQKLDDAGKADYRVIEGVAIPATSTHFRTPRGGKVFI